MSEHLCISRVPLFNHLSQSEQKQIAPLLHHQTFKKGELIFSPDSQPHLSIVARGQMKIYRLTSNGREQLLRLAETGQYEGENQLFGIANTNLYGEALTETRICLLYEKDFQTLLQTYPQLNAKLLTLSAQKLAQAEEQAQYLAMDKVEERLASYLLNLVDRSNSSTEVTLPMTMKELSAYLGTRPETLSRRLKTFSEKQWIQRQGRHIQITAHEALEKLTV